MVQLRWNCDCATCSGGETPKGAEGEIIYGGWHCMCNCHKEKAEKKRMKKRKAKLPSCKYLTFTVLCREPLTKEEIAPLKAGLNIAYRPVLERWRKRDKRNKIREVVFVQPPTKPWKRQKLDFDPIGLP